jgi:hypothetical protein
MNFVQRASRSYNMPVPSQTIFVRHLFSRFTRLLSHIRSSGSSVSIVTDYRLDYRATGVRSPAEEKDFSCNICVQTSSEATQPPIQWVPGVLFPGVKRGLGVTLTTHPI